MIYKNTELYNVEELIEPADGRGKILTRIPNSLRTILNPSAKQNALSAAGCEIRFNLEGESARIVLKLEETEDDRLAIGEVFQGAFHFSRHFVGTEPTEITVLHPQNIKEHLKLRDKISKEKFLPFDAHLTRVILPYRPGVRIIDIEGDIAPPRQGQIPERKYLAYGSSITHGSAGIRPTGPYAMRTAQILGADLINLGFGGGAHCEKEMAEYIARREDWDFATLEMGINMVGDFEVEEFKNRVEYFIERIARSRPDKWVFCIDLFPCYWDFDPASTISSKPNAFREIVRETVERLNMEKLIHIDGREILKDVSGLTFDLTHPAASGMEQMASNLSRAIEERAGKI